VTHFDVFNGDADGLCALHQLRLAQPLDSVLVTGVKRDNALLARVPARAGDRVTALDLALPGNRDALRALLARGVAVQYVDHHEPGDVPSHPLLTVLIDTAAEVCTSILVDRLLGGAHRPWAVVAAFGDNLPQPAQRLAAQLGVDAPRLARLRELGECLNYNAYGITEADLVYRPVELYRALRGHAMPDTFIEREPHFATLAASRRADLDRAMAVDASMRGEGFELRVLPDAAWARRVFGSFANHLANAQPARAQAVAVPRPDGAMQLSLRLPADAPVSADSVVRPFGGGGRRTAAGIDALPATRLAAFAEALERSLSAPAPGRTTG
jgi:hypothetical protein